MPKHGGSYRVVKVLSRGMFDTSKPIADRDGARKVAEELLDVALSAAGAFGEDPAELDGAELQVECFTFTIARQRPGGPLEIAP